MLSAVAASPLPRTQGTPAGNGQAPTGRSAKKYDTEPQDKPELDATPSRKVKAGPPIDAPDSTDDVSESVASAIAAGARQGLSGGAGSQQAPAPGPSSPRFIDPAAAQAIAAGARQGLQGSSATKAFEGPAEEKPDDAAAPAGKSVYTVSSTKKFSPFAEPPTVVVEPHPITASWPPRPSQQDVLDRLAAANQRMQATATTPSSQIVSVRQSDGTARLVQMGEQVSDAARNSLEGLGFTLPELDLSPFGLRARGTPDAWLPDRRSWPPTSTNYVPSRTTVPSTQSSKPPRDWPAMLMAEGEQEPASTPSTQPQVDRGMVLAAVDPSASTGLHLGLLNAEASTVGSPSQTNYLPAGAWPAATEPVRTSSTPASISVESGPSDLDLASGWIAPAASLPGVVTSVPPLIPAGTSAGTPARSPERPSLGPSVGTGPSQTDLASGWIAPAASLPGIVTSVPPLIPADTSAGTLARGSAGTAVHSGMPQQAKDSRSLVELPQGLDPTAASGIPAPNSAKDIVLPSAQGTGPGGFGLLNFVETVGERRKSATTHNRATHGTAAAPSPGLEGIDRMAFSAAASLLLPTNADRQRLPFPHPALTADASDSFPESTFLKMLRDVPPDGSAPGAAPAPAPAPRKAGGAWAAAASAPKGAPAGQAAPEAVPKAAVEGEASVDDDSEATLAATLDAAENQWWAGQRVMQPAQVEAERAAGKIPQGPYLSGKDFNNLTDKQLYQVFTKGVADVPSTHPGEVGKWTFCVGQGLFNAFTNESWPHGVWPQGDRSPFNQLATRLWRGNTFYTDPVTKKTIVVNMILSNSSVAWVAFNVTNRTVGYSPDKKPSMFISYSDTELIPTRFIDDELRRVGPNVWLGRAWIVEPIPRVLPTNPLPFTGPLVDAAKLVGNETYKLLTQAIGFQGPNSNPTTSGWTYPEPGEPWNAFWFSLECTYDAAPQLFYLPISPAGVIAGSLTGYYPPFFMLPGLNPTAGQFAVENWLQEFPTSVDGPDYPPFILWPWKWSDLGPIGYLKIPAYPFELINGVWFLYNPTAPGEPTFHLLPFAGTVPSAANLTQQVVRSTAELLNGGFGTWMSY
eukprot:jgi/Botrbrau1/22058/Bobra.0024s0068.2